MVQNMVPASVSDKFDMPNESKNFDYNFIQLEIGKQHTWFLRRVGLVEVLPAALGMMVKNKETQNDQD